MKTRLATAFIGALLLMTNAAAGTVWLNGWDNESGRSRLLGFDENGSLRHTIDGEAIMAADVCEATGTLYYFDMFTLKAVDTEGNVSVIAENIGETFTGAVQVKVGQRYCTVWTYALWNQEMHIIRNAGTANQQRIDTVAFDTIVAADIDDTNDDLWIGQLNGRLYRVSKKTGLRSYRVIPVDDSEIRSMAVKNGVVHVMRTDAITGYTNTTTRSNPQVLYVDTIHNALIDATAGYSSAAIYANAAGDPVVNVQNMYFDGGYNVQSDVVRMEMDVDNGALRVTGDSFEPFADFAVNQRWHGDLTAATERTFWVFNSERLRKVAADGTLLLDINFHDMHANFSPYGIAY